MTEMPLQRESVARAALRLVNEVGLDGLTTRRLAAYLNIQSPSLYWHFANKQALLNSMAETMVADALTDFRPPESNQDWAIWLAEFARIVRRMMLAQRDGARIMAEADLTLGPLVTSGGLALQVLRDVGFTARAALAALQTVFNCALGSAFEIQAEPPHTFSEERQDGAASLSALIDASRNPTFAEFAEKSGILKTSQEELFEQGLCMLLDGMQVTLARETQG
jgi:TetR/AcrR family tetracycline transcriptional repressor